MYSILNVADGVIGKDLAALKMCCDDLFGLFGVHLHVGDLGLVRLKDLHYRLKLTDADGKEITTNEYFLVEEDDTYDWANTNWVHTPIAKYASYAMLDGLRTNACEISSKLSQQGLYEVTVSNPTDKDIEGCAYFLKMTKHDFWGGTYDVYDGYSKEPFHTLWLCNVTHFVCGHHPKSIGILQVA